MKDTEGITALDKFKRRLVRDIARRIYQEKQTEEEMFEHLGNEYGCDCKLLWDHMKSLTMKKLKRLLAADDRTDYITKIARMTSTDWLTFDLVLVHEKLDVIGEDMMVVGKSEPTVHTFLFDLVRKHDIETIGENKNMEKHLIEAWFALTQEYNTGGRECSPMLLQRRWYQLKETTRVRIYEFWRNYRGNPKLYEKAIARKPTQLQVSIVETYPIIVTDPFEQWEDLIINKKVILASAFEIKRYKDTTKSTDGEPDLIVIEPNVETIELGPDSDNDEDKNDDTTSSDKDSMQVKDVAPIKAEPDDLINIEESESVEESEDDMARESEKSNNGQVVREIEMDSEVESEILLPKITSVVGNVILTECNVEKNAPVKEKMQAVAEKSEEMPCEDDDDDVQIVTGPSSNNSIAIDDDLVCTDSIPIDGNKISDVIDEATEIENDNAKIHSEDLTFVDDGIEIIDDTDFEMEYDLSVTKQGQDCEHTDENDIACKIDPKLIMFPITYTRKIDDMNVFKNSSFLTVKGNDIIERVLVESKPKVIEAVKEEEASDEESDDDLKPLPRLKYSSWRLQKPKNRSYNPIQLCKNPDFNTRLKKLTVGFFSSERNRLLFSACKPLTIDLHKGFEDSLVDNTLYLETTDRPTIKEVEIPEACENTASVIPSAMAVQCLLDKSKLRAQQLFKTKDHCKPDQEKPERQQQTNDVAIERNKVVKLPNIQQIRLQNLLVAEVSPMPLQNNTPPVQLVNNANRVSLQSNAISNKSSSAKELTEESRSINYVLNNKTKIFRKKKFNNIPKIKPTNTLPAWTQPSTHCPVPDESLITKDTLHKMLCVLRGYDVPKASNIIRGRPKNINKKEMNRNAVKIKLIPNTPPPIDLTKDTSHNPKRRRKSRTVSSKSGYCCWAKYRVNTGSLEQKLRHLCPKPFCKCCCRSLLISKMLYDQGTAENLKIFKKNFLMDYRNEPSPDVSLINENPDEIDEQNKLEKTESTRPSTNIEVTPCDKDNLNSDQSHLLNDTPLLDVSSHEASQAAYTISADYESQKQGHIPLIKTRVLSESWATKSMNVGVTETLLNDASLNSQSEKVNDQPKNNTEPIIVIDEDETQNESENNLATAEQILPKGVSIVLLPDKRVSVAIDPDVEVDPVELAKVPEILVSVQKYLTDAVINDPTQNNGNGVINSDENTKEISLEDNSNIIQMVDDNNIVNQETVSNNTLHDSIITDIAFNVTVSQSDSVNVVTSGSNITNDFSADDSQQSNTSPVILKSNEQIVESTHSYVGGNLIQTEVESHSKDSPDNADIESDVTRRSANRTTILSDLMAMSGISQEDSAVPLDEPVVDPLPTPRVSHKILNYTVYNDTVDLDTQGETIKGKLLKKVIVSIRKKPDQNVPLLSPNSVIDLTEDCDNTKNAEDSENQESDAHIDDTPQNPTDFLDDDENLPSSIEFPLRVYKRPNILRKSATSIVPFKIVKSKEGSHHFEKEVSLKSTYKLVNRNDTTKGDESLTYIYNNSCSDIVISENESSDDEPLAKKMRRIRGSSERSTYRENASAAMLVLGETYNVPVEFSTGPLTESVEIGDVDTEAQSILGVSETE